MPCHAPLFLQSQPVSLNEHHLNYKTSAKSAHLREHYAVAVAAITTGMWLTHSTLRVLHNKADISSESKACMSMDAWMYTRHEQQALETYEYSHSRIIMILETENYIQQSPSEASIRSVDQIIPRLVGRVVSTCARQQPTHFPDPLTSNLQPLQSEITYIQEKHSTYKYCDGKLVRHLGNPIADRMTKHILTK
jgi:hypothetical protein